MFQTRQIGRLRQIPRNASEEGILAVDSCTLKLSNQKNGWRGVCINHHADGDPIMCPVRTIGRLYVHTKANKRKTKTFLSSYWIGAKK